MRSFQSCKIGLASGLLLSVQSTPAHAGAVGGATITQLVPGVNYFGFVAVGDRASVPACAASAADHWVIDNSTPQGQAMAASIMTAFSTGKKVSVVGTGNCPSNQGDTEQVFYLVVWL